MKTTIQMAREAAGDDWGLFQEYMPEIHRLAELVRADERARMAEQPAQQEPDELRHIGEQDCLLDVDEKAWRSLVENRGGCRCHISPPCGACSNPISEEEMNEVGYTYTSPQPAQRTWVGLSEEEIEDIFNNWPTYHLDHEDFARAIEAKLREKNS